MMGNILCHEGSLIDVGCLASFIEQRTTFRLLMCNVCLQESILSLLPAKEVP